MRALVPTLADLAVMLALLPRSATGQKITTYFNMVTGPRSSAEPDGPEALHVILMDNGRTNILGTEFDEALYCIRCAACLIGLADAEALAERFAFELERVGGKAYRATAAQAAAQVATAEQAIAGITGCDAAIAETGSLGLGSRRLEDAGAPGRGRVVSLLPPIHIAIVRLDQLVYSAIQVFRRLRGGVMPSQVVL